MDKTLVESPLKALLNSRPSPGPSNASKVDIQRQFLYLIKLTTKPLRFSNWVYRHNLLWFTRIPCQQAPRMPLAR